MMPKILRGQTALITGAAKRIGEQIALALAAEGVNIVIHYRRSAKEADDLRRRIMDQGVQAWSVGADFENPAEYETLISRTLSTAGSLEILINSASIFLPDSIQNIDFPSLVRHLQVNAWVPLILGREFKNRTERGKIINLLDTRISGFDPAHTAYILSKQALAVLTRMMAVDFAPRFTVNAVAPGLILPPSGKDQSYLDRLAETIPLKRHGSPGDVAEAVLYLLKSDFITGEVLFVDGGRHLMETNHGPHIDS